MKLWLISQTENREYDTYDCAIVAYEAEEEARQCHPGGFYKWQEGRGSWASTPELVKAEYIGEAREGTKAGVICASFNAG